MTDKKKFPVLFIKPPPQTWDRMEFQANEMGWHVEVIEPHPDLDLESIGKNIHLHEIEFDSPDLEYVYGQFQQVEYFGDVSPTTLDKLMQLPRKGGVLTIKVLIE